MVMAPLEWRYIIGVEFTGHRVELDPNIFSIVVQNLLGFVAWDKIWKGKSIRCRVLAIEAIEGVLT